MEGKLSCGIGQRVEGVHTLGQNPNPSEWMIEINNDIQDSIKKLYDKINDKLLSSKEKSIALTQIEQLSMIIKKGIFQYIPKEVN